jgi:hypothetical protein
MHGLLAAFTCTATIWDMWDRTHLVRSVLNGPPRLSAPAMTDAAAGCAVQGFRWLALLATHNKNSTSGHELHAKIFRSQCRRVSFWVVSSDTSHVMSRVSSLFKTDLLRALRQPSRKSAHCRRRWSISAVIYSLLARLCHEPPRIRSLHVLSKGIDPAQSTNLVSPLVPASTEGSGMLAVRAPVCAAAAGAAPLPRLALRPAPPAANITPGISDQLCLERTAQSTSIFVPPDRLGAVQTA